MTATFRSKPTFFPYCISLNYVQACSIIAMYTGLKTRDTTTTTTTMTGYTNERFAVLRTQIKNDFSMSADTATLCALKPSKTANKVRVKDALLYKHSFREGPFWLELASYTILNLEVSFIEPARLKYIQAWIPWQRESSVARIRFCSAWTTHNNPRKLIIC